jgi:two-component system nitrogen regulation response regulator GlnG
MNPHELRVLVADDEPSIRFVLRETLEEQGCIVTDVDDGDAALDALATGEHALAFLDIRMPGPSGLELLERIQGLGLDCGIVIMTAQNSYENAVEAMKRGALDYLVKPFGMDDVKALAAKVLRTRELEREVRRLRREVGRRTCPGERLVGKSGAMLDVFKTIGRVSPRDVPVLITGESGTGKELVARAIHAASPRAERAFVAVNTAAIPRDLLESELFGHERGAFTGAVASRAGRFREASGGTLFLDEIGDMSSDLQAKLLRVLQDQQVTPVGSSQSMHVDVRILAATHRDLDQAVREGAFREDLLYRLRVVPMHLPPLRDRREDIRVLADHFVAHYADELAGGPRSLADETISVLMRHSWPGNVRELENAMKRALVLGSGSVLSPEDRAFIREPEVTQSATTLDELVRREADAELDRESDEIYRSIIERVERPMIEAALARTEGNQIRAAALLGINRNTLRKKIVDLDITLPGRE